MTLGRLSQVQMECSKFQASIEQSEGCMEPEGVMDQADLYGSALLEAERYRVEGDQLEILDGQGSVRMVFKRDAPLAGSSVNLAGTAWRIMAEGGTGRGIRAPTIAFLDDRLATGVTACRPYAAFFSLSEGNVNFMSTSMLEYDRSCPEEARQLEGEFTDFLTWAREYSVYEEGGFEPSRNAGAPGGRRWSSSRCLRR